MYGSALTANVEPAASGIIIQLSDSEDSVRTDVTSLNLISPEDSVKCSVYYISSDSSVGAWCLWATGVEVAAGTSGALSSSR